MATGSRWKGTIARCNVRREEPSENETLHVVAVSCHAALVGAMGSRETSVTRWLVRAGLLVAGVVAWIVAGLLLIVSILSLMFGKSAALGVGGIVVSAASFWVGKQGASRGLRPSSGRHPNSVPGKGRSRPVSLREAVATVTVCLAILMSLFALAVHDAGGVERLLLTNGTHGAISGWWLLLPVLGLPLAVTIHELGHVLAGTLTGMRFQFVQVGPVALLRTSGGLRLRWNHPLPDDVLGLQSSVPEGERAIVARLVAHAAGGAALNIVTATLAWGLTAAVGSATTLAGTMAIDLVRAVGVLSALGALNLVPLRTPRGRFTDGALIRNYVRLGGPALRAFLRVNGHHARAGRPKEWGVDAEELARWAERGPVTRPWFLLLALGVALDRGEWTLARELLSRAGDVQEPMTGAEFALQRILLDALDGRAASARERLSVMGRHPWNSDYPALAEAAVLLGEGRSSEASEALQRWDRLIAASPPAVRVGNEWAEEIIRARIATASSATGTRHAP